MPLPPGATFEDDMFGNPGGNQGPNVEPAGSSEELKKPTATWPTPGVIRELNAMWLHPGLLDLTGTGFSTPSAIQKLFQSPPGISFGSGGDFSGLDMPPFDTTGGGRGGKLPTGPIGGGGQSPIPNIFSLLGLAENFLKGLPGDKGGGFNISGSPGPDIPPDSRLDINKPQVGPNDTPEFTGNGLIESLISGQVNSSSLVDQYGNIQWDKLGINENTNPQAIEDFLKGKGIDVSKPGWLGTPGLEGPGPDNKNFGLGMNTSLDVGNTDIPTPTSVPNGPSSGMQGGVPYFNSVAPILSLLLNSPNVSPEAREALGAAQAANSIYTAAEGAPTTAENLSNWMGAAGTAGSFINSMAGGPKEAGFVLQDLGTLASMTTPAGFVMGFPMLGSEIVTQAGLAGQHPYPRFPTGYVPVGNGYEAVNPLTGAILNSPGRNSQFGYSDQTQQGQRATADQFLNWDVPSPLYQNTLPSVQYLLQGLNAFRPGTYDRESGGYSGGGAPVDYSTFNTPQAGDNFQAAGGIPQGPANSTNPYMDALNQLYQQYLGRGVDPSGYQTYAPVLANQGPQQVVNDIIRSPEFQQYAKANPDAAAANILPLEGVTPYTFTPGER